MPNFKMNTLVVLMLIIALLSALFALGAPYIFTSEAISSRFSYTETGSIGDMNWLPKVYT